MRAVPSPRRASTNKTRLNPYPAKPTAMAATIAGKLGKWLPEANASAVLQTPATRPFRQAINIASLVDT